MTRTGPGHGWILGALSGGVACLLLAGCSLSAQLSPTAPTALTQQLLIRSLERGLARLDLAKIKGRGVSVDVYVHAGNEGFYKQFVTAWLQAHGVKTVSDSPELKLKVFASVLGTDHDQALLGIPAFTAPIINAPFPEIALFKWVRNRGRTELRLYAYDPKTDTVVEAPPPGTGQSKYDDITVLLFFSWTVSDLEKQEN